MIKKIGIFIFLILYAGLAAAANVSLNEIRTLATQQKIRLTFVFNQSPAYQIIHDKKSEQFILELPKTQLKANLSHLKFPLRSIKIIKSQIKDNKLRIVIEMNKSVAESHFILQPSHTSSVYLLVDLLDPASPTNVTNPKVLTKPPISSGNFPKKEIAAKEAVTKVAETGMSVSKKLPDVDVSLSKDSIAQNEEDEDILIAQQLEQEKLASLPSKPLKYRDIIVVIDPGHGGKDPGAIGPTGIKEKNVVLAISRELQYQLNQVPGVRAVLTRKGDYYIGLRERLHIARQYRGDLFVAIHADAFDDPTSAGSSVFALSSRGASSEAARWLAEKENYSEVGEVKLDDKSDLLRSVLIDLSQTATINSSLQLGNSVLQQLSQMTRLHCERVEQARFVVLKSPDIPSLLIETGFVTNPMEARRLNDPDYQQDLAAAIQTGIKNYYQRNPPLNTLFSQRSSSKQQG